MSSSICRAAIHDGRIDSHNGGVAYAQKIDNPSLVSPANLFKHEFCSEMIEPMSEINIKHNFSDAVGAREEVHFT